MAGDIALGHFTHEKSTLGAAAGLATINYIEKNNLIEHSRTLGSYALEQAQKMRDGSTADDTVSVNGNRRKTFVRRLPYIAALAAASFLAVFTLRFVNGINMGSHDSAAGVPAAEQAAAPAEEYAAEEYAVEEAAPAGMMAEEAAPAVSMAKEEAPAETAARKAGESGTVTAGAGSGVMYDMTEEIPDAEAAEADMYTAQMASEEPMAELYAAAEAEETEEAAELEEAPAASFAAAGNTAGQETMAADAEKSSADEIRAFAEAASSGQAAVLDQPHVRFDGSAYTVDADGKEYSYRYLVTAAYTDKQGISHTVYILSDKDEMTESEARSAAEQGISAEKGYILLSE